MADNKEITLNSLFEQESNGPRFKRLYAALEEIGNSEEWQLYALNALTIAIKNKHEENRRRMWERLEKENTQ